MTSKRNDAPRYKKGLNEMSRKSIAFPCVLKTIINDTHRDDKAFTLNDKQIRSRLRAKFNDAHVKNTSWVANNVREYNAIRATFDARFAQSLTRKPRTKKASTKNVEPVSE